MVVFEVGDSVIGIMFLFYKDVYKLLLLLFGNFLMNLCDKLMLSEMFIKVIIVLILFLLVIGCKLMCVILGMIVLFGIIICVFMLLLLFIILSF